MTPTMPTTVTRLMNLKRARHRNPLQQCPRLCSRPCSKPNSFLKRYDWFLAFSSLGLRYLAGFSIASSVFNRCSHRWYKRQLFPKNRLQSLSSLQTLHPSRHSIWMLSSSLPSLLLAMAASFSLSLCRKSKGTTSLTFCGRSTAFSTTSPNLLNSTLRWADKLCLPSVIIILLWCYDTNIYISCLSTHRFWFLPKACWPS